MWWTWRPLRPRVKHSTPGDAHDRGWVHVSQSASADGSRFWVHASQIAPAGGDPLCPHDDDDAAAADGRDDGGRSVTVANMPDSGTDPSKDTVTGGSAHRTRRRRSPDGVLRTDSSDGIVRTPTDSRDGDTDADSDTDADGDIDADSDTDADSECSADVAAEEPGSLRGFVLDLAAELCEVRVALRTIRDDIETLGEAVRELRDGQERRSVMDARCRNMFIRNGTPVPFVPDHHGRGLLDAVVARGAALSAAHGRHAAVPDCSGDAPVPAAEHTPTVVPVPVAAVIIPAPSAPVSIAAPVTVFVPVPASAPAAAAATGRRASTSDDRDGDESGPWSTCGLRRRRTPPTDGHCVRSDAPSSSPRALLHALRISLAR